MRSTPESRRAQSASAQPARFRHRQAGLDQQASSESRREVAGAGPGMAPAGPTAQPTLHRPFQTPPRGVPTWLDEGLAVGVGMGDVKWGERWGRRAASLGPLPRLYDGFLGVPADQGPLSDAASA